MKSGFVVLLGRSNVGKSTLLNSLVGTKVAITSPKPQTTRFAIHGIVHDPRGQIVFVDTPGIFEKAHDHITKALNERAREAVRDINAIVYVADPTRPIGNEEHMVLRLIEPLKIPKILAINKIDVRDAPYIEEYRALLDRFNAVLEVSGLHRKNLKQLIEVVLEYLPEGEPFYPEFQFTNIEHRTWLAELIREKVFIQMGSEVPYTVGVELETAEERKSRGGAMLYIKANILTTAPRYKKMLVGSRGQKIKEMGSVARKELEAVLGRRVFLDLEVVVEPHWPARLL